MPAERMSVVELMRVTPWEMHLLRDLRMGLTYRAVARKRCRKVKTVERTFERLRAKLRPWGGGSKGGLVHWVDVYEQAWLASIAEDAGEDPGNAEIAG